MLSSPPAVQTTIPSGSFDQAGSFPEKGTQGSSLFANFADFAAIPVERPSPLRAAITAATRRDEQEAVNWLLPQAASDGRAQQQTEQLARRLVSAVRRKRSQASGVDALMHEFSLSCEEGVALMCLAEALLRIPDTRTADRLIADKISRGDWKRHLGESPSLFVNAATWGLLVTGKLVTTSSERGLGAALTRLIGKGGEPLIRKGLDVAMRLLGNQFVTGQTIAQALVNGRASEARGYRHSYDMLGEAALCAEDASRYYAAYEDAIHAIGKSANGRGIKDGPGISVKLSALHPRYARAQRERVMTELLPRLLALAILAKQYDIGINIDAEEADRLELSLDLLEALAFAPQLAGFDGIGFVVQAYQKRCPYVIDYLADLARRRVASVGGRLMVRLVKGAYWDAEIKRAQVDGQPGYPVYTRKAHTDVSYLVCARRLIAAADVIYPQFATHNAHTLAAIHTHAAAAGVDDYEFQCLHGMGETLYDQVVGKEGLNRPCRIYAPVGPHRTLLAYLVRRLLENGANSSFVNQIVDPLIPIEQLVADPVALVQRDGGKPHAAIALPADLYGAARRNSAGFDFSDEASLALASSELAELGRRRWQALPLLAIPMASDFAYADGAPVNNPADRRDVVGTVTEVDAGQVDRALAAAVSQAGSWDGAPPSLRAQILEDAADLLEQHRFELMALAVREAGKSMPNALAEVREAVDFLRYYALQAVQPAGDGALGVVVCISPWNFPLAIFIGQVAAALAAGNVVLAKPAEQTPLIAFRATQLLHAAGVPRAALQLLPGQGETIGAMLCADPRVDAVVFTGSGAVAASINRTLAQRGQREQRLLPLIAETGGQNAMIVDSSALTEQVVGDVLASAFDSAGQRCSALRVLCLQEEIADRTLEMLTGALAELQVGVPDRLKIDIGPVIDEEARGGLERYIAARQEQATIRSKSAGGKPALFHRMVLPEACAHGSFVAPTILGIEDFSVLEQEVFGPVLHVLRYRRDDLPRLLQQLRESGYGLTLGIHTRIDETIAHIVENAHVGNIYVNRNIVGAVVGVQPFGGEGKSGTGPKAGGPLYLARLRKNAAALPPALNGGAGLTASQAVDPALVQLGQWAGSQGRSWLAELAAEHGQASLPGGCLTLPGPTGEINTLRFAPRGDLLCVAADQDTLLRQLSATLATGNRALLTTSGTALLPGDLPAEVRNRIGLAEPGDEQQAIAAALWDGVAEPALPLTLAARAGALVPLVQADGMTPIALWRLVAERALCVNTTAAGGNASLMTLQAG